MHYICITIKAIEAEQDLLISQLSDENCIGFEQQSDLLLAFFNEKDFDLTLYKTLLENFFYKVESLPEQNWNEIWESNFEPVVVGDFCAIRADFHSPITYTAHEIIITPKMSFGTGHHATTYMMIEHMQRLDFTGKNVFDFGTGTGVLSILAEKLGANSVVAIDIDEWSINNAKENFDRNGIEKVQLYQSSQIPDGPFDIILANINKNVITQSLPQLKKALKDGGRLLISGILGQDEEDIMEYCNKFNLALDFAFKRNNWVSHLYIS